MSVNSIHKRGGNFSDLGLIISFPSQKRYMGKKTSVTDKEYEKLRFVFLNQVDKIIF